MPIFGIDLGAGSSVVAALGKREVTIVRNDLAERLTPSLVSFTDKERLIGDAALTSLKSNLSRTPRYFKNLLGATNDESSHQLVQIESSYSYAPIGSTGTEGLLGFNVGEKEPVTATEVLAAYLKRLQKIGEGHIGAPCGDVVVAVPSWFTDVNRAAVLDACEIAGVKCYKVMSHAAATAVDYGLFRSSTFQQDKPQVVGFVDIGTASATASIVEFRPSNLRIVAVEERIDLGGRSLDHLLMLYLAEMFKNKSHCDILKSPKAMLKLATAVEKTKKVLSANKEGAVHVECLMEDEDFEAMITRDQFECLAGGYKEALENLLKSTIARSGYSVDQIGSVEIIGGGVRVPFVQGIIEEVFGKPVSRTVSADECVARGAAIQGGMLHPCHRVKRFNIEDIRSAPVHLTVSPELIGLIHEEVKNEIVPVNLAQQNNLVLFESGSPTSYEKRFVFPVEIARLSQEAFELNTCNWEGVTVGLGMVKLCIPKDIKEAASKARPDQARFKVYFHTDINSIVQVSAVFQEDYIEQETYITNQESVNEAGETVTNQIEAMRDVPRIRETIIPTEIQRPRGWLGPKDMEGLIEKEKAYTKQDQTAQKARHLANSILDGCFRVRNQLDAELKGFATDSERQVLIAKSHEWEEWVETHTSDNLGPEEYQRVWDEFQMFLAPVRERYQAHLDELKRQEDERRRQEEELQRQLDEQRRAAEVEAAGECELGSGAADSGQDPLASPEVTIEEETMDEEAPTA